MSCGCSLKYSRRLGTLAYLAEDFYFAEDYYKDISFPLTFQS
jgi:hypothetical protein